VDSVNAGFWDLSPEERRAAYEWAAEHYGAASFWDLNPEERGSAYNWAERHARKDGDD
jgi:hypothetical protein